MRKKILKIVSLTLGLTMLMGTLTGCGGELEEEVAVSPLTEKLYAEGDVDFQESTLGIYSGDKDVTSKMQNGCYYIYHDEYFYPVTYDWINYEGIGLGDGPDPESKTAVFDSTSIINIPTLFEGDKLFYFSTTGVYDYTTLERFKTLGWSLGLNNLQSNTTGRVFFETGESLEDGIASGNILTLELQNIYDFVANEDKASDGQFMIDKVGGVNITNKNVENGILTGLERGKAYDLEIYSGTEFMHYTASASVFYLKSYETYAIWECTPLQDYLYEIKVPDYLKTGYYDVSGTGFMRLVRGDKYNESTDYNEQLLFPFYDENEEISEEELTEEELKAQELEIARKAGMYSENDVLNTFVAKDETCFGYRAEEDDKNKENDEEDGPNMDKFFEASTTRTSIWLPKDKDVVVSIATNETTGSVYLEYSDGSQRRIPYNRLMGGYVLELTGTDQKADIVVKGLYKDYKIKLTNAESYKGQDGNLSIEESQKPSE